MTINESVPAATGSKEIDSDKKLTAIHEAGHAIAHHRLGIDQEVLTIRKNGAVLGSSMAEGLGHILSAEDAAKQAIAYMSGYAALIAAGHSEATALAGAESDAEQAECALSHWLPDKTLDECKREAVELMSESRNQNAVTVLAQELLQRETIGGQLLDVVIDYADGEISPDEYQQFLRLFVRS